MLNKLKKPNQKGFTIIEVMIVLAIAGLILLIVFLAIPALQRNSRNTQRKNDVAAVLGAIAEYANNNNGGFPTNCSGTNPVTVGVAPNTTAQAKMGYYNTVACTAAGGVVNGKVTLVTAYAATGPFTAANQDGVVVVKGAACNAAGTATQAGSARAAAAVYEIETGAGTFGSVCQET